MARIETIEATRYHVPLVTPYRLAFGAVTAFDTILVECESADGRRGLGEATVLTGYTDETIEDSWQASRALADALAGRDPGDARRELSGIVAHRPFVATAFGTALEMLQASPHLAFAEPCSVPLLGLVGSTGEAAMAPEIEGLLAAGYRTLKLKVGFDAAKDAAHVATAQRLVKNRAQLRVDANQGYGVEDGIAFVRALEPDDIELFEQPCAAGDWDAHLAVAQASPVPMMLDESIYGLADIERAAELHAARFIKLKLMKLGTLDALVQAIARVRALGMRAVLGNGVACDPGCWMEACVAARHIDNAGEMNGFLKAKAQLFETPLRVERGALQLAQGFVPRIAHARVEPFRVGTHRSAARATIAPATGARA